MCGDLEEEDTEAERLYAAFLQSAHTAIHEAIGNAPRALKAPAPDVMLVRFDNSSIAYRGRFWIEEIGRAHV